jgi:phosphopantothenoylcysteine decarboxylase/phosphopantothenate--cysteine ligase
MKGKKILLGVTGGIAAYKTPMLVRLLVKAGTEVRVIATPSAFDFVTAPTLATLSKNPVLSEFTQSNTGTWNNHVELGLWADLMVIAPLTANTLGKLANGLCDNLLLATYLSARCPVMLAPAMDLDMWQHPAVMKNIDSVRSFGNVVIEPVEGELASGLVGKGRMAEPEEIFQAVGNHFNG